MKINKNSWHYKINSMFGLEEITAPMSINHYVVRLITSPIWYIFYIFLLVLICVLYPFVLLSLKFDNLILHIRNKISIKSKIIDSFED